MNPFSFSDHLELLTTENKTYTVPTTMLLSKLDLQNTDDLQAMLQLTIDIKFIQRDIVEIDQ